MTNHLRQSTASQETMIGPFVDDTDMKTPETGLTIANTDIRLSKAGGNMGAKNSGGGTHDEDGMYQITLDATDTATVGFLRVSVKVAGALYVWRDYEVLEEVVYDALYKSGAVGYVAASDLATLAQQADAMWDEDIVAAHGTADTSGLLLRTLGAGIAGKTKDANLNHSLQNIIDVIESARPHHTGVTPGNIFYVDPVNGDTHANGNRGGISDPYLTIQDCHDNAVTDSNHDIIMLVPGNASGVTTHTVNATTTISKRFTFIRGPGRDFVITRTGNGDTLAFTGEGISIEDVQISTAATGAGNGISVTADFAMITGCWINDTQGDGVNLNQSENCIIERNRFQSTGAGGSGDGIEINGTGSASSNNIIRANIFESVQGDAIKLIGGSIIDTIISENIIHSSTGWGINIGAASVDAFVNSNCLGNNSSGDIQDNGTTTVDFNNEIWGTSVNLAIVDGVVDDILADTNELQSDDVPALIAALNNITAADVLAAGDIDGFSLEESAKLALAALAGDAAGAATTTMTFKAADGSKVRITVTVDSDGNRSGITLDAAG